MTNKKNMNNEAKPDTSKTGTLTGSYTSNDKSKNWKPLIGILLIVVIAATAIILVYRQKMNDDMEIGRLLGNNEELNKILLQRDSLINEWIVAFDQIEEDLKTIKHKENLISVKTEGEEISEDKKQDIIEDIKLLNTLLDENKKRIAYLEKKLKKSGISISSLEDKVKQLEISLNEKDSSIIQLKTMLVTRDFAINELNEKVENLNDEVIQSKIVINMQENQMNKAYFTMGSFKQLKEKGVIDKSGGFIGMGKTKTLNSEIKEDDFEQINILETKSIPVNSKKINIITEHPAGSYELITKDDMIASIEIKDPAQFWKISKYAVIETVQ